MILAPFISERQASKQRSLLMHLQSCKLPAWLQFWTTLIKSEFSENMAQNKNALQ